VIPLVLAGVLGLAAAPATTAPPVDPVVDTVRWSGALGATGRVEIDNPRGAVRLRGGQSEEVELLAKVQRLGSPGRRAAVDVAPEGDRLRVRVHLPEGARGRFEDRVDLVVVLPRRTAVVARGGFGRLEARGLAGPLEASTESGEIALDLAGGARVHSISGRIEARLARAALAAGVELGSRAGAVRVELARDAEGELEVRSRDRILFDLVLPFRREAASGGPSPVRGRIGEGTGRLAIEAGGEIQIVWARAAAPVPGGAP